MQIPLGAVNALCSILHTFFLPEENTFPSSWYTFRKHFDAIVSSDWNRIDICIKEHHIFKDGELICPFPGCGEAHYSIKHLSRGKTRRLPRKWFYSIDFIKRIKNRFSRDKEWVKVFSYIKSMGD